MPQINEKRADAKTQYVFERALENQQHSILTNF